MKRLKIHPIHPFPARMAPSIVSRELAKAKKSLKVLDPMAGSGTTIVTAKALGHEAIGCDTDPLAVLIASSWASNVDTELLTQKANTVLRQARKRLKSISQGDAYPAGADEETREFLRKWFDARNRRQLIALATEIALISNVSTRALLWCAFSRMIITKVGGVSLAMDVSHSRPHVVYEKAPITPFKSFPRSIATIARNAPFTQGKHSTRVSVRRSDARQLPVKSGSIDLVITSPPYLNAIDYLRGHKLSLVWMGHTVGDLRKLRSTNVGSEVALELEDAPSMKGIVSRMGRVKELSSRQQGMLVNYAFNMELVLREIRRVLKKNGKAVLVVGDSTIRGVFIKNSNAIKLLGERNRLTVDSVRRRPLAANRRYLPPPTHQRSGSQLQARMREEVIITMRAK